MNADPLAALLALPGVADAASQARDALGRAHRHPANLRGWPVTAAESALRAARASAVLDGGAAPVEADSLADPVFAGALRVAQALEGGAAALVTVWQRAPLQALARLHALAAADLDRADALGQPRADAEVLGRPRADPGLADRLELLGQLVTGGTAVPAPILAAVAHGEILALAPFAGANGVVARAVSRLVTMSSGLDPHGLGVPEVHWMRRSAEYRSAAVGFASGTADGLGRWLVLHSRALQAGAQEALAIADLKQNSKGQGGKGHNE